MTWWLWLVVSLGLIAALWPALVVTLLLVGRRQEAGALAGFIPDCIVLYCALPVTDAR